MEQPIERDQIGGPLTSTYVERDFERAAAASTT